VTARADQDFDGPAGGAGGRPIGRSGTGGKDRPGVPVGTDTGSTVTGTGADTGGN